MIRQEGKEGLAQQAINSMVYEKPKISYKTIRKNTNLDKYFFKKAEEEEEEETKDISK